MRHAPVHLGFFDGLFSKPTADDIIGDVANPAEFSPAELSALKEASICSESPAQGEDKFSVAKDAPPILLQSGVAGDWPPRNYYDIFRNERGQAIPVEVWSYVRARWPVLADKSDEELFEAIKPIKAVFVDFRTI